MSVIFGVFTIDNLKRKGLNLGAESLKEIENAIIELMENPIQLEFVMEVE